MLGTLLGLMARYEGPGSRARTLALLTLRLVLFVTAAAWASRQFGTPSGLLVLLGAIASRAFMVRARTAP